MSHVIRLMLAALVALIATAAVACGQDTAAPPPTVAPGATLPPEAPAATLLPTERPVAASASEAAPAATPTSRAAATATPQGVARSVREPENDSLKVISSRSIALPSSSSSSLLRLGGFSSSTGSSVNPQTVPTEGGLTVSAIGLVTVAADEAYLVITPERVYSSSGGQDQMTDEDRQQIRENLAEIGISEESVEFDHLVPYGPSNISVEFALDELDEKKEQILDAVESVIRRYESYGIIYSLTEENCETTLSLARREAIPRAERAADDLAEALGVERDGVTGALEYPLGISVYGLSGFDSHSCGAQASTPYPSLVPFDAEPQVEVSVGLQITYGLR